MPSFKVGDRYDTKEKVRYGEGNAFLRGLSVSDVSSSIRFSCLADLSYAAGHSSLSFGLQWVHDLPVQANHNHFLRSA